MGLGLLGAGREPAVNQTRPGLRPPLFPQRQAASCSASLCPPPHLGTTVCTPRLSSPLPSISRRDSWPPRGLSLHPADSPSAPPSLCCCPPSLLLRFSSTPSPVRSPTPRPHQRFAAAALELVAIVLVDEHREGDQRQKQQRAQHPAQCPHLHHREAPVLSGASTWPAAHCRAASSGPGRPCWQRHCPLTVPPQARPGQPGASSGHPKSKLGLATGGEVCRSGHH